MLGLSYTARRQSAIAPRLRYIKGVSYFSILLQSCTRCQVEVYDDKDQARKDEIAALGGQTGPNPNVFTAFYERLNEVRHW